MNITDAGNGAVNADQKSVLGSPGDNTGRYGLRFGFRIGPSDSAKLSTKMYSEFGRMITGQLIANGTGDGGDNNQYRVIDTVIRVTGFTTGNRVDVPVRITKKV